MTSEETLAEQFHRRMINVYEQSKSACDYMPTRFLQMVQEHGGVETARRLLAKDEVQTGLITLWECHRLDLSMEALVIQPRFHSLFTTMEIATARDRLEAFGYFE
jgi:hypothetical protein